MLFGKRNYASKMCALDGCHWGWFPNSGWFDGCSLIDPRLFVKFFNFDISNS